MILEKASNKTIKLIIDNLAEELLTDPTFMYFCPDKEKRYKFIVSFLNYYIYEWSRSDTLLCNQEQTVLISLVDPKTFEYKFKGKGNISLKKHKTCSRIFIHRETTEEVADIIIPQNKESKIMSIYGNIENNSGEINLLINEAMELAKKENFVLCYETFSKRLLMLMKAKGFNNVCQKRFLDTQFIQTFMVYNL